MYIPIAILHPCLMLLLTYQLSPLGQTWGEGVKLHLLERGVFTQIIWDSSLLEICLFSLLIYSVIYVYKCGP